MHDPNLMVMDVSSQQIEEETVSNYQISGYLVLFLGRLQRENGVSEYVWRKDEINEVKECKSNIIKGNSSHHGSSGEYYSFGNRANYGVINTFSITRYTPKNTHLLIARLRLYMMLNYLKTLLGGNLN